MGKVTWLRYVNTSVRASPTVDSTFAEEDDSESSEEDDSSVRIVSPPPQPITRSVSAKREADEMEDSDDLSQSSPPRPRKVHRIGKPGIFPPDHDRWPVTDLVTESSSRAPLFMRSPTFEPTELIAPTSTSDTAGPSTLTSHIDQDYYESENPWKETIRYF